MNPLASNLSTERPLETAMIPDRDTSFVGRDLLRPLFFVAALVLTQDARGEMYVNFTQTPRGGIALDLSFQGITQPDTIQHRWIELILPQETILGGGSARSDYHFDHSPATSITANGIDVEVSYVRLGNHETYEQFFIFMPVGIADGADVDMHIMATWEPADLAFAELSPGTYQIPRPRYGGAIVHISSLPADFDGDDGVNGGDLLQWQREAGTSATLASWESDYGTVMPPKVSQTSVPEPSSIVAAFVASFVFLSRSRKS